MGRTREDTVPLNSLNYWKASRVKWGPFCNFRGPLFKKGGPRKGEPNPKKLKKLGAFWDVWHSTWVGLVGRFAAILEHSGQLKKPGLEFLHNPRCLSGEIMTQTKKRKAIETVRGYKSSKKVYRAAFKSVLLSVMFPQTLLQKKSYLFLGLFCLCPIWRGNVNFMWHFFRSCRNRARLRSRINPDLCRQLWKAPQFNLLSSEMYVITNILWL